MPRIPASQKAKPSPEAAAIEQEPPAKPVKIVERRIEIATIEVPLGEPPHEIRQVHLNLFLNRKHAQTFARLRQGLTDSGGRTDDGRLVATVPDILRWLMEQIDPC